MAQDVRVSTSDGSLSLADEADGQRLSQALQDPEQFRHFVQDPRAFASSYGVHIDQKVSDRLRTALANANTVQDVPNLQPSAIKSEEQATLAAIAVAWAAPVGGKIAVAF